MIQADEIKDLLLREYGIHAVPTEVLDVTEAGNVYLRCTGDCWCDAPTSVARLILGRFPDINLVVFVDGLVFSRNTLKRANE